MTMFYKLGQLAALPYRDRVEVFAKNPKGKIYGGIWDADKSFALPGGGVDEGEDPAQAGVRELMEETGIQATNPSVLPVPAATADWSDAYRQRTGRNFAGTRTQFILADVIKKLRRKQLDQWGASNRGYYSPEEALTIMAQNKNYQAPEVAAGRIASLKHIQALLAAGR